VLESKKPQMNADERGFLSEMFLLFTGLKKEQAQ
jgi:hypothetical protein